MNPWQRKAQERRATGAWLKRKNGDGHYHVYLPELLRRLAYERQECGTCEGDGGCICVLCDPDGRRYAGKSEPCGTHKFIYVDHEEYGESCQGTGLSPDYRKAQKWAKRLGLEDG